MTMYFLPGPPTARENLFSNDLKLAHICAACGSFFEPGESFIALLNRDYKGQPGLEDLPALEPPLAFTKPERYPYYNVRFRFVDRFWHWMGQYSTIFKFQGVEIVAAHIECFKFFRLQSPSQSDLLWLWQVGAWRQPWIGAVPIDLSAEDTIPSRQALKIVAEACNMPQLLQLPTEIFALIWQKCSTSLLWRLAAVLDLADSLAKRSFHQTSAGPVSMPLCHVQAWERGQEPTLRSWNSEDDDKSVVQLTLDSGGICKVEVFSSWPQHSHATRKSLAFITEYTARLSSMTATFQNGLLRLRLSSRYTCGPDIWDISNPPHPDTVSKEFNVLRMNDGYFPEQRGRFHTVNLEGARGISFFFGPDYGFYGLFKHTQELSLTRQPMETSLPPDQDLGYVLQLYVPLAEGDRILAMATRTRLRNWRHMTSLVIWTQLAGEVTIGPWMPMSQPARLLSGLPPDLISWDACESDGASILGAYSTTPSSPDALPHADFEASPVPQINPLEGSHGPVYFSHAPLSDVRRATVFEDASGFCRAILFEYENGAQRMVGECRIGELSCTTYEEPELLYTLVILQDNPHHLCKAAKVEFAGHGYNNEHLEHDDWSAQKMRGTLNFFFTADECGLCFVDSLAIVI